MPYTNKKLDELSLRQTKIIRASCMHCITFKLVPDVVLSLSYKPCRTSLAIFWRHHSWTFMTLAIHFSLYWRSARAFLTGREGTAITGLLMARARRHCAPHPPLPPLCARLHWAIFVYALATCCYGCLHCVVRRGIDLRAHPARCCMRSHHFVGTAVAGGKSRWPFGLHSVLEKKHVPKNFCGFA